MMQYGNDKMNGVAAEAKADTEMESDFIESGEFFGSSEPLVWRLGRDGVLVISGLGKVPDFSCGRNPAPPWEDKKELIRELVIREGVDEIGIRAFAGCKNLKKISLPETLCRIDAYAFADCTLLDQVLIPEGVRLCHIYEDVDSMEDREELRFGIGSFYRTPWAIDRWGDYYISEGILYACFSDDSHLELPAGVGTINKFAFASVDAETVTIPDTVTSVRDYAFSSSHLKYVTIPESVARDRIGDYAFAGTELSRVEFPAGWKEVRRVLIDQLLRRPAQGEPDVLIRLPGVYEITLKTDRRYDPFRKIMVRKKRPKKNRKNPDSRPECIYGNLSLLPGISLHRRILQGSFLMGILYDDTSIQGALAFYWNQDQRCPVRCEILPSFREDESGRFVWQAEWVALNEDEDNTIEYVFAQVSGPGIEGKNVIRASVSDTMQEWFWVSGDGYQEQCSCGDGPEINLLNNWMKQHPDLSVACQEEE